MNPVMNYVLSCSKPKRVMFTAKRAARQQAPAATAAYIERKIPYFELLSDEALELIEHNADTVLEEIGHNSWSAAYASPELYSWFDQHRTTPVKAADK